MDDEERRRRIVADWLAEKQRTGLRRSSGPALTHATPSVCAELRMRNYAFPGCGRASRARQYALWPRIAATKCLRQ